MDVATNASVANEGTYADIDASVVDNDIDSDTDTDADILDANEDTDLDADSDSYSLWKKKTTKQGK
eukprot:1744235-Ditylum_brightwellii.AAC.1